MIRTESNDSSSDLSPRALELSDRSSAIVPPRYDLVVIGIFAHAGNAADAVNELHKVGFTQDQIGFASPKTEEVEAPLSGEELPATVPVGGDPAEQGALAGAVTGAGVAGLLALGAVAGAIPVLGPIFVGGLFASILAGAATGGVTGGLVGALIGLGISQDDAQNYEGHVRHGSTIVTVTCPGRSREVSEILLRHGALRNGGMSN